MSSLSQIGTVVALIVSGITVPWTLYQWQASRQAARQRREEDITSEEHRLTRIETKLDSHEGTLSDHAGRISTLERR